MNVSALKLLAGAWRDFRRVWLTLTVADLMARVLGVIVLAPLVGLLLKVFLMTTTTGVVTDAAIASFLLHPIGLLALFVVSSVCLAILLLETGQLMVIGFGAVEARHVTWLAALRYALRRTASLLQFAGRAVPRLLLIMLPFLAVIGALYALLLQAYDINYYLTEKPPVFLGVAATAGVLLVVLGFLLLQQMAGWSLALPMILFEGRNGREAMATSVRVMAPHRRKLTLWLIGWLATVLLLFSVVSIVVRLLSDLLIPRSVAHLDWFMAGLIGTLLISALANLAMSVLTTALFPLCLVRLYRGLAGPGQLQADIGPIGSLDARAGRGLPGKAILGAEAILLAMVVGGGYALLRQGQADEEGVIIAHRGGAAVAPENTLAAFQRGIHDGADWLELDVQEDADGTVVVAHDRDFMRVARSPLPVWQTTSSELEHLDVGSFFDPRFADQRVPTLEEVLRLAKDHAGLFIELKYYGHDQNLESKVAELVERNGMVSNIVVMSLQYEGVRKTAALRPDWTYGLLNAVALGDLTRLEVDFLALSAQAASRATIQHAQRRGIKVYAWTVNDPVQMMVMLSRGVDGIITDQVALAREVKKVRVDLTPFGRFLVWMAGESGLLRGMEHTSGADEA